MPLVTEIAKKILRRFGIEDYVAKPYHRFRRARFVQRYGAITRFTLVLDDLEVTFSTEDDRSKYWFFPKYDGGKIYEEPVTRLIVQHLRSAKCFADIGANIGYYTCLACKAMSAGSIYAFEMDGHNYSILTQNISLNGCGSVRSFNTAVMDTQGVVHYEVVEDRLSAGLRISLKTPPEINSLVEVPAIGLDEFFDHIGEVPDITKIDVEGAEFKVLSGMHRILEHDQPTLFIELHPDMLPLFGSCAEDVVQLLLNSGYSIYEVQHMRKFSDRAALRKVEVGTRLTSNTMLYAYIDHS